MCDQAYGDLACTDSACTKTYTVMLQDLGQKISSYASALFQLPRPSVQDPPMARDPSRCIDYAPDLQSSAGAFYTLIESLTLAFGPVLPLLLASWICSSMHSTCTQWTLALPHGYEMAGGWLGGCVGGSVRCKVASQSINGGIISECLLSDWKTVHNDAIIHITQMSKSIPPISEWCASI